jgi:uncharacterized protein HemY
MAEPLDISDVHCLRAAMGWLELGNLAEAELELGQLLEKSRQHPDVLEVEWLLTSARHDWNRSLAIGELLVALEPERASGWIHCAYAMRRAEGGGLTRARETLLAAADKFPEEPVIPYNLACYAAQLGELDEARRWLRVAMDRGGFQMIQTMALADADLQPLWEEVRQWKKGRRA